MKYVLLLLLPFFLSHSFCLIAQDVHLRFVPVLNEQSVGGSYQAKLQISSQSATLFSLGSSNIRVVFNDAGLSPLADPIILEHLADNNVNPAYADINPNGSRGNILSLNIELLQGSNVSPAIGLNWVDLVTLGFTIDDTEQNSGLAISTSFPQTVVYREDQNTLLTPGLLQGLDEPLNASSLPLEWLEFTGEAKEKVVELHWKTAEEVNNDYFVIEHAIDAINWHEVGRLPGNRSESYNFQHTSPAPGLNYYRIRQTDIDLTFTHSPVISLFFHQDDQTVVFFPNPACDFLEIRPRSTWPADTQIRLSDALGRNTLQQIIGQGPTRLQLPAKRIRGLATLTFLSPSAGLLEQHLILLQ